MCFKGCFLSASLHSISEGKFLVLLSALSAVDMTNDNPAACVASLQFRGQHWLLGEPEQVHLADTERPWDLLNPGGGCWTVLNRQTPCCSNRSKQLRLTVLFKGCTLLIFDRRWVGGYGLSQYSCPVISTCNKWMFRCLLADQRTNSGLCYLS